MMCELVLKCATLIAVIHVVRLIGRRAGPRASGLILGLPSSSAILLILCAREQGTARALEMADAGLLGLIAAVALPMAYAQAVRRGWNLAAAMAAAVAAYVAVAGGMGLVHPVVPSQGLAVSLGSILTASVLVYRVGIPAEVPRRASPSRRGGAAVRTFLPLAYVLIVGVVTGVATPRWAGLVSSFPSMSTVVLAVTHLEEGAASASRIARALPPANLSTAAFLAAFRFGSPALGMAGGVLAGYLAALANLAAIEWLSRSIRLRRQLFRTMAASRRTIRRGLSTWPFLRYDPRVPIRAMPGHSGRVRPPHRRHFAPRLEMLPC